ncbi:MAG TPA: AAA family ATPase [Pirellulales bacterium]|nr:AAA family ATPase [Pirellulales bacterium]
MRISELRIDRFGVWSGLEIGRLDQPLVVFYGENEAGKTTLMQFVRTVLYGFSAPRRERYVAPRPGGTPGGSLTVDDAQHTLTIHRYLDVHSGDESVDVVDGSGQRRQGRGLARLLEGVEESVFNNVFAFGLREIQELSTLSDSAAADLLYELTLGGDRVSLSEVVGKLHHMRDGLLADGPQPGRIVELFEQKQRLKAEVHGLRRSTPDYLATVKKFDDLNQAAQTLEAEEGQMDERLRVLAAAAQIEPRWLQRQEFDRKRRALDPVPQVPDDALSRLAELKNRRDTRARRLQRVTERRQQVMADVDRLKVNEALCRQAPRLEALSEQQHWIAALDAQARQLASELAPPAAKHPAAEPHHGKGHAPHSPAHHASHHAPSHSAAHHAGQGAHAAGDTQTAPHLLAKPLSGKAVGQLRSQAKSVTKAHQRYKKLSSGLADKKQAAAHLDKRLKADLGHHDDASLTTALEKAGALVSQLRRRVQIDERLDTLNRNHSELEEQLGEAADNHALSPAQLTGLGLVFVLGFTLILCYFLPEGTVGSGHLLLPVVGFVLAGASAAAKIGLERFSGYQLDEGQSQLAQVEKQLEKVQAERDELDKKLPKGGGPLVTRLQAAEKELARLEELMPLDAERQSHGHALRSGREEHRTAKQDFRKARERWQQLLRQAGLPPELTPRQVREAIANANRLDAERKQLDERQRQLAECRGQYDILCQRIAQVADDARLKLDDTEPLAMLREMLRRLEDERIRATTRDQSKVQLVKLRRVRRKLVRQVAAAGKRVADLIQGAGAVDEEDLRRRAAIVAEARHLEQQRDTLGMEIGKALISCEAPKLVAAHLDAGDDLRRLAEETTAAKHDLRLKLEHAWEERGAIAQQMKVQAQDRRLPEKRLELATVEEQLREAVGQWQAVSTCTGALESVRSVLERERQPEVLREASSYLAELTAGRYRRIWTTLGGQALSVDDADGNPLTVDVLSRGTREQIFLSLRLALVSAYARRGIRLPVVMDDVLVNFDVIRAKAAARVLAEFARAGHQLLIFTCHEHLARLFHDADVEVRTLPGSHIEWDEPVQEPPRQRIVPAPHFLPEPVPTQLIVPSTIPEPPPIIDEIVPLAEPEMAPEPVRPPARPAAKRNGQTPRPRRAKSAPPPRPAPQPQNRVRRHLTVESVPWSAEEFEGELVDRVRRSVRWEEPVAEMAEEVLPTRVEADRVRLYQSETDSAEADEDVLAGDELVEGEVGGGDDHDHDSHAQADSAESDHAAPRPVRRPTAGAGRQSGGDRG